jgi:MinD superfamily P-loop ATPase
MKVDLERQESVGLALPSVDESKCTACGECARICQFNAIALMKKRVLVFPELCHGCGGCVRVCKAGAITEVMREVGVVESGSRDGIEFVQGRLNIGQPMSPAVIHAVKGRAGRDGFTIIDCAPGTTCPVVAAVKGSDAVLLVTEPTPFGLNDLRLAVEMVRTLRMPLGVVVNRVGIGDDRVHVYCREQGIPILMEIPDDLRIAAAYSRGGSIVEALPEYRGLFRHLMERIADPARAGWSLEVR